MATRPGIMVVSWLILLVLPSVITGLLYRFDPGDYMAVTCIVLSLTGISAPIVTMILANKYAKHNKTVAALIMLFGMLILFGCTISVKSIAFSWS